MYWIEIYNEGKDINRDLVIWQQRNFWRY